MAATAGIDTFSVDATAGPARRGSAFGYVATEEKKHRRAVAYTTKSEDDVTTPHERRKLKAIAEELNRNFEVPAFGLRLHLDYVAGFSFKATSGNEAWDDELEAFVANWSQPLSCDASGRHSLDALGRLWESHRTMDGDLGVFKLRDGRVQLVEGDRIKDPPERRDGERWVHGVKVNPQGAALAFAIHNRSGSSLAFDRTVPASWMCHFAYRTRYDQVRGISPLAAAMNRFRDCYEGFDLALAKNKIAQLYGLAVFRSGAVDDGRMPSDPSAETESQAAARAAMFRLDPNRGPYTLNLNEKDKTEVLESKNPSIEFQAFTKVMLRVGLLAFDIPDCFIDPIGMNYATMKTALTLYLKRCEDKRRANRELRDHLTRWRVGLGVANGELDPAKHGVAFEEIRWRWIPRGVPWFDKGKEVPGDVAAVQAGFQTVGQIIEERFDGDLLDVLRQRAKEEALARSLGIVLPGMQPAVASAPAADDGEPADDESDPERAKAIFDAYGAGVRAGAITPQRDDERHFRAMLGVPALTPPVADVWTQEPTRRPVTLTPPPGDETPAVPAAAAAEETGDADAED